jgi:hypothetical protein
MSLIRDNVFIEEGHLLFAYAGGLEHGLADFN